MSSTNTLSREEWQKFCEDMLRHHYGVHNFWKVPDEDCGDYGIEFFTADGTLFQCYCPDPDASMQAYKTKIQNKIRTDLGKLSKYQAQIKAMLDDLVISRWVLVTPDYKSKDLIAYCNGKKKELVAKNLCFIDGEKFCVKIETADSYPAGKLFANKVSLKTVDIQLAEITADDKDIWKQGNSRFMDNISRKSDAFMGDKSALFKDRVVSKYILIERFLDRLRQDYPDIHILIEDSARAQLEEMADMASVGIEIDQAFIQKILEKNAKAFGKHNDLLSDSNTQNLSIGYLSKWIAECFMNFQQDSQA